MLRSVMIKKLTLAPIFVVFAVIMICGKRKCARLCMQMLSSKKEERRSDRFQGNTLKN